MNRLGWSLLALSSAWERRLIYSYNDSHRSVASGRLSEAFPYLVSLHKNGVHICAGTLISEDWVVTAAHCLGTGKAYIAAMQARLKSNNGGWLVSSIDAAVAHEHYDMDTIENDVALLHLASPLKAQSFARLENSSRRHPGSKALVVGWGSVDEGCLQYDDVLREGDTSIVGSTICSEATQFFNWSERICTAHINSSDKAIAGVGCGDSGGPLLLEEDGGFVQVGIVSFTAGGRDYFTRAFTYLEWINNVMNGPIETKLPKPRCHGVCCDDPDFVDVFDDECYTWWGHDCENWGGSQQQVDEVLVECSASCKRCPTCEATNVYCCDVAVDFLDSQGRSCTDWQGKDCSNPALFSSQSEMDYLHEMCPYSCSLCNRGTDCTNNGYWLDPFGYSCADWRGADCLSAVATYGYSPTDQENLLRHCPRACGFCGQALMGSTTTGASGFDDLNVMSTSEVGSTSAASWTGMDNGNRIHIEHVFLLVVMRSL